MIGLNEALAIHEILVERFGGAKGIRDKAGLDSAINRPIRRSTGRNYTLIL